MLRNLLFLSVFGLCLVQARILSIPGALNYDMTVVFPTNIFNSSCVSSSCPGLNNDSLCGSNSSVDNKATLQVLSECMKNSICDHQMDPKPLSTITANLADSLPSWAPITFVCYGTKGGYYSNVVPNITPIRQNKFTLSYPKIIIQGVGLCNITAVLPLLTNLSIAYKFVLGHSSVLSINENSVSSISRPSYQVLSVDFGNFAFPVIPGVSGLMSVFLLNVKSLLANYSLSSGLAEFYESLINSALQVVSNNCKKLQ